MSASKVDKDIDMSVEDFRNSGNNYEIKINNMNKELSPIKENNEERPMKRAKDSNHLDIPG